MGFKTTGRDLSENLTTVDERSSFSDNFGAGVGLIFDEESSISSIIGNQAFDERNEKIRTLVSEGVIPSEIVSSQTSRQRARGGTRVNYDAVARYLNSNPEYKGEPLKSDLELTKERNDQLAMRRAYRDSVTDSSTTSGKVGNFLGMGAAAMLDPINIAATLVTPMTTGARGASRAMYALSQSKRGTLYGMTAAAAVEPFVHSWKEEIGAEYTMTDSLFNIAASGLLEGSINGVAAAVSFKADLPTVREPEVRDPNDTSIVAEELTPEELEANADAEFARDPEGYYGEADKEDFNRPMNYEEREEMIVGLRNQGLDAEEAEDLAQFVYESTHAPDPKMDAKEFVNEMETTQQRMDQGTPKPDKAPELKADDQQAIIERYETSDPRLKVKHDADAVIRDAEIESYMSKLECLNG